jgi:hypothetical protein
METLKLCTACNKSLPFDKFKQTNGRIRNHTCKSCIALQYRSKLKLDMLTGLGDKCACCGESHPVFLTLDHVNNDGNEHRQDKVCHQIMAEARQEGWPKDKYQVLCMNCNFAKGHYGVCPHTQETAEEALARLKGTQKIFGKSRVITNTNNVVERVAGRKAQALMARVDARVDELLEDLSEEDMQDLFT